MTNTTVPVPQDKNFDFEKERCPRTVGHPGERTVQVLVCGQLISLSGMTICPSVGLRPTG